VAYFQVSNRQEHPVITNLMIAFLEVPISSHILTWLVKRKDKQEHSVIFGRVIASPVAGVLSHMSYAMSRGFCDIVRGLPLQAQLLGPGKSLIQVSIMASNAVTQGS
jgi:hypothetical protein